jgi:predicted amidohydrolase YtcJ
MTRGFWRILPRRQRLSEISMTKADLVLHSGRLRTFDPAQPRAEALAIADGRLLAAGDNDDVLSLVGQRTEAIDLDGAAVIPGLTDSHLHPFWGAMIARGVDLTGARSLEDVRRDLSRERVRCAPNDWILGFGLDYNVFEHVGVSQSVIEDAVEGRPSLLTFSDLHTGLATREALRAAGIDGPHRFEERAEVVCVDGVPTGELREIPALDLVRAAIPPLTEFERYRLCAEQLSRLASVGLTGAHVMDGDLTTLDLLRKLEANGELVTRLVVPFWIKPDAPEEQWEIFAAHGDEHGSRWRACVAKFFIDGVIDTGTGWLFEPDSEGQGVEPYWPDPQRYRRAVAFFARRGFQCVTHATGDRGVHEALDAYREAGPPAGASGALHRIEHIERLQPDDLPRFAREGVAASMQAQHLMWLSHDRLDNWSKRLGPERCERAYPMRALLETGAIVALGSDWPVAHYDPRQGLAAAQLRRPAGESTRAPYDDKGLDGLKALHGYTTMAASAVGEQHLNGRLSPGFRADVTVMAEDPVDCLADNLPANQVLLTVVAGEIVYADSALA